MKTNRAPAEDLKNCIGDRRRAFAAGHLQLEVVSCDSTRTEERHVVSHAWQGSDTWNGHVSGVVQFRYSSSNGIVLLTGPDGETERIEYAHDPCNGLFGYGDIAGDGVSVMQRTLIRLLNTVDIHLGSIGNESAIALLHKKQLVTERLSPGEILVTLADYGSPEPRRRFMPGNWRRGEAHLWSLTLLTFNLGLKMPRHLFSIPFASPDSRFIPAHYSWSDEIILENGVGLARSCEQMYSSDFVRSTVVSHGFALLK